MGIEFEVDPTIVRALDYYTKTVFEFKSRDQIGAQGTVCGGGRYDGLVEVVGGPASRRAGLCHRPGAALELVMEAGGCECPRAGSAPVRPRPSTPHGGRRHPVRRCAMVSGPARQEGFCGRDRHWWAAA